ncbi:hypothetical protein PR048_027634 [Dryococelus australis]|uniref:Uncharacterized protein n=1 Tax=Dryococelus australis TaxID=614101 RepID=A0ABQ9GH23_9NEOP|nr:hypothetical protein PR048_027634 [Dryococelus australis]
MSDTMAAVGRQCKPPPPPPFSQLNPKGQSAVQADCDTYPLIGPQPLPPLTEARDIRGWRSTSTMYHISPERGRGGLKRAARELHVDNTSHGHKIYISHARTLTKFSMTRHTGTFSKILDVVQGLHRRRTGFSRGASIYRTVAQSSLHLKTTVAERLACSPPAKAIRVRSPAGSLWIFARGNCAEDAVGQRVFSGISHFPRPFIPTLLHTSITSIHSFISSLSAHHNRIKWCLRRNITTIFNVEVTNRLRGDSGINVPIVIDHLQKKMRGVDGTGAGFTRPWDCRCRDRVFHAPMKVRAEEDEIERQCDTGMPRQTQSAALARGCNTEHKFSIKTFCAVGTSTSRSRDNSAICQTGPRPSMTEEKWLSRLFLPVPSDCRAGHDHSTEQAITQKQIRSRLTRGRCPLRNDAFLDVPYGDSATDSAVISTMLCTVTTMSCRLTEACNGPLVPGVPVSPGQCLMCAFGYKALLGRPHILIPPYAVEPVACGELLQARQLTRRRVMGPLLLACEWSRCIQFPLGCTMVTGSRFVHRERTAVSKHQLTLQHFTTSPCVEPRLSEDQQSRQEHRGKMEVAVPFKWAFPISDWLCVALGTGPCVTRLATVRFEMFPIGWIVSWRVCSQALTGEQLFIQEFDPKVRKELMRTHITWNRGVSAKLVARSTNNAVKTGKGVTDPWCPLTQKERKRERGGEREREREKKKKSIVHGGEVRTIPVARAQEGSRFCYVLTASHPVRASEEDRKPLYDSGGGGKTMTGFELQARAARGLWLHCVYLKNALEYLSRSLNAARDAGREVCDCECQAVKDAAGRLDYWTRCFDIATPPMVFAIHLEVTSRYSSYLQPVANKLPVACGELLQVVRMHSVSPRLHGGCCLSSISKHQLTLQHFTRRHCKLQSQTVDSGMHSIWAALNIEALRADEDGAAPELKGGETEYPRENPPTSGLVRHDSHMRKSTSDHRE